MNVRDALKLILYIQVRTKNINNITLTKNFLPKFQFPSSRLCVTVSNALNKQYKLTYTNKHNKFYQMCTTPFTNA